MSGGLFSYRHNMRLKSPCEIASDMTLRFSAFPNFRKKLANLRLPLNVQKQKVFQLQRGFAPWPPDQGLYPWTSLGAPPPNPRYRLALCVLAMAPLCQILNTPLHDATNSPEILGSNQQPKLVIARHDSLWLAALFNDSAFPNSSVLSCP